MTKSLNSLDDMADPDGALEGAGWCATGGGAVFGKKGEPLQTLSFGDELSHPITVLSADFDACILPDQQCALVKATLVVTNEHVVGSDIKATLRFPLPDGAVVSGFQLQIGEDMWVDAMGVTKKKAAAVAYKEKEAGRAVATTEAVQGSIWSTEVFREYSNGLSPRDSRSDADRCCQQRCRPAPSAPSR